MGGRAARAARRGRPRYGSLARLILDTAVLVDAERDDGATLEAVVGDDDDVAIAGVTVAELKVGVLLADGQRRGDRKAFVDAVLDAVAVEGYDLDVAEAHAALLAHTRRSGRSRGAHDLVIAATARARQRQVVSSDSDGFADLPEVVLRSARKSEPRERQ